MNYNVLSMFFILVHATYACLCTRVHVCAHLYVLSGTRNRLGSRLNAFSRMVGMF